MRHRLLVYISQNKIPAVTRLLERALRRKQSDELILEDLVRAASGDLRVRQAWSDKELDTANLARLLGGPKLLYALSRTDGYASHTTLQRKKPIPEIIASAGCPTPADYSSNMSSILGGRAEPSAEQKQVGHVAMMDDIAIEAITRYDEKKNRLVGQCREHAAGVKATIDSMEDIERLEQALKSGTLHHAAQATVVGLAPVTASDHYTTLVGCGPTSGISKALSPLHTKYLTTQNPVHTSYNFDPLAQTHTAVDAVHLLPSHIA